MTNVDPAHRKQHGSIELYVRNSDLHSPTIISFENGKLFDEPYVGVVPVETLYAKLKKQWSK